MNHSVTVSADESQVRQFGFGRAHRVTERCYVVAFNESIATGAIALCKVKAAHLAGQLAMA